MAFWTMMAFAVGLTGSELSQAQPQMTSDPDTVQVEDVEVVATLRDAQLRARVDTFIESNMAPPAGRHARRAARRQDGDARQGAGWRRTASMTGSVARAVS